MGNQIIPVNTQKNGQPVFPPGPRPLAPAGPPVPPEIAAAADAEARAQLSPLDGIVGSMAQGSAGLPKEASDTPPPLNVPGLDGPETQGHPIVQPPSDPLSDIVGSVANAGGGGVPQKHKGLLDHIKDFLPLVGAIGGAMEAAGEPNQPHQGAEMLARTNEAARNREMERYKIQQVDAPLAQAHSEYFKAAAPAKVAVAGINAEAKTDTAGITSRFKAVPGVGLYDTKVGQLIPGTQQGVSITPEMAQQYQLPADFVGKQMKISDLAAQENAISRNLTTVQGAKGPALVNKTAGTGRDLGLGAPSVAARQAGVVDAVDSTGNVTPMTDAQRLALGAPRANTELGLGKAENKIYEPAVDADTRLKQMLEQVTDKTGASDQALLFNHIAMTGGQVKGLRMGEYLTEAHRTARGIDESLGVLWNHLAAGQSLSPQQRANFVRLAEQVRQSRWDAARRQAALLGVTGQEPLPDPDLPPVTSGTSSAPAPRRVTGPQKPNVNVANPKDGARPAGWPAPKGK